MTVTCLIEARDICGESIVWDERRKALVWVDIVGRRIHRLVPATGAHEVWPTDAFPASIGLTESGGAIVGLGSRVALWDFAGDFVALAVPEPDAAANRLNEGCVAPDGSYWVGTMQNNIEPDGSPREISEALGRLYRVAPDGVVTLLTPDRFGITNTMAWTGDGRFLTADTLQNTIFAYSLGPDGLLGERRPFFEGYARGFPDGSCLDAEGFLWNCRVAGGRCLARIAPDGRLDRIVELPCSWPTSCTFGGDGLSTLYVTSARFTMTAEHLAANPLEGAVFAVDAGCTGRPEHRFRR